MNSIWKYKIETTDYQEIEMPIGAQILCVQIQHGEPHIWAIVNTGAEKEKRIFQIYGTGNPFSRFGKNLLYIGTYQIGQGDFVFHVFEDNQLNK